MEDYNEFFDSRIKMGKAQVGAYIAISFVTALTAMIFIQSGLTIVVITEQWQLTEEEQSTQLAFQLIFTAAGGLIAGFQGDSVGRKAPLIFGLLGLIISNLFSGFSRNFSGYFWCKSAVGFFTGYTTPFTSTIIAEITPTKERGKYVLMHYYSYPVGECITIIAAYSYFYQTMEKGDWSGMTVYTTGVMGFITFILANMFVYETPRFLIKHQQLSEAIKTLDWMGRQNDENFDTINDGEYEMIKEKSLLRGEEFPQENFIQHLYELFYHDNYKPTLSLLVLTILVNFMFVIQLFMLPIILSRDKELTYEIHFYTLLFQSLMSIPGNLFCQILIDKETVGRRYLVLICLVFSAVICFSIYHLHITYQIYLVSVLKIFTHSLMIVTKTIISEVYSTNIRMTGTGFNQSLGRILSAGAPFILYYAIDQWDIQGPYILAGIFTLVSMLTILGIKETTNIPLDSYILIMDDDIKGQYESLQNSQDFDKENDNNVINNQIETPDGGIHIPQNVSLINENQQQDQGLEPVKQ